MSSIPGKPSFEASCYNHIAVVPLLQSMVEGGSTFNHSEVSFHYLMSALTRFAKSIPNPAMMDANPRSTGDKETSESKTRNEGLSIESEEQKNDTGNSYVFKKWSQEYSESVLVIPNSQLTRPGDWRYEKTPLRCFDWEKGCQRLKFFDGRMGQSRPANDRLTNKNITENWVDLIPSRQTAAVIGVLNCRDCTDSQTLILAKKELIQWANIYLNHPYEISATANNHEFILQDNDEGNSLIFRMFVFDSFHEQCAVINLDFGGLNLGANLVAFPPIDPDHTQMMDIHVQLVLNDLTVNIFRMNEHKISAADSFVKNPSNHPIHKFIHAPPSKQKSLQKINESAEGKDDSGQKNNNSEDTKSPVPLHSARSAFRAAMDRALPQVSTRYMTAVPQITHRLFTPLDEIPYDMSQLLPRDIDAIKKRDVGRREKVSGDYCLLAGSPLDAYERYTHAAELAKSSHDPLWYASSIEGCATAYIAMTDAGGHSVDEYLDQHFQLPEDVIALATSNSFGNDNSKKNLIDKSKTTLPSAVFTLAEEALSIYCRHPKLAPLYAELLLKLAAYTADKEEDHLHLRWGQGEGCYSGDDNALSKEENRWERSLMAHVALGQLGVKGRDYALFDSLARCQKCMDLLQRAVSAGGLDNASRADVAINCARICLKGVTVSHWGDFNNDVISPRLTMARKAGYFITIAAESMSKCSLIDSKERAATLWLAASNLYSRGGNSLAGGGNYAWATLRASSLHALSQMDDHVAAEQATELLLGLLSEISPDHAGNAEIMRLINTTEDNESSDHIEGSGEMNHSENKHGDTDNLQRSESTRTETTSDTDTLPSSSMHSRGSKSSTKKAPATTLGSRGNFFATMAPSALSISQSKWLDNEPVPPVDLPLVDSSIIALSKANNSSSGDLYALDTSDPVEYNTISSPLLFLHCVANKVRFDTCAKAQSRCVSNIFDLRKVIPSSCFPISSHDKVENFSIYGSMDSSKPFIPIPLRVQSAFIVKSESHMILEKTKAVGYKGEAESASMKTFFNPYENKKKDESNKKDQITLVAEGEERTVSIEFSNSLSVPLDIPSCHLVFDCHGSGRIEAPPLSFTVPAKSTSFKVNFPFIVLSSKQLNHSSLDKEEKSNTSVFELEGLRATCMNRSYFLSLKDDSNVSESNPIQHLPDPASVYQRSSHNKKKSVEKQLSVKLESVPPQPNLLVSFTTSLTPLEDNATVPVHLSDGEIYTIPAFRLENDFGSSGLGKMERLQIIAVGLPGLQDEILFDTDKEAAARGEDVLLDTDSEASSEDDFDELMEYDGLPPLKMKVIAEELSLQSINDKSKSHEGSVISAQVAATHDMGNFLANGGHVRIRFRFKGPNPSPAFEIWRRREISLRIVRVKGPRISSLSFRPDLSWGGVFSELSRALAQQRLRWKSASSLSDPALLKSRRLSAISNPLIQEMDLDELSNKSSQMSNNDYIVNRVGVDQGVHVSGDEVVVLMAVANETSSTIILSNRKGRVGGFESSPMPTVKVTSGVSVKIPVVIQRIDRRDEKGDIADIATELIARTALEWESEAVEGSEEENKEKRVRNGRVRIPSRCLREIIDEHKAFASRICQAPVRLKLQIGTNNNSEPIQISPGVVLETTVKADIQSWIPNEVLSTCNFILEFCCAKKDDGKSNLPSVNSEPSFIWCGQIRRTIRKEEKLEETLTHKARISFVRSGKYFLSACMKITSKSGGPNANEEIWWAPKAEPIIVMKLNQ